MKCPYLNSHLSEPEWAFRNMKRARHIAYVSVFDRLGLKDVSQPVLLFILDEAHESGDRHSQKELAEILNISASTLTISIKSLERHGFVERTSDESDRRRNFVDITPLGAETAHKCRAAISSIDEAMYSGFSPEEMKMLTGFYSRISNNLLALGDDKR